MIKDNLYYYKYSMDHPDPIWDRRFYDYLSRDVEDAELKNIKILESYLKGLGDPPSIKDTEGLLEILKKNGCEKSYFSYFLRTCDLSSQELINEEFYSKTERIGAMRQTLSVYRHRRGLNIATDKNSLQAYNDAQTAKRRSSSGEEKIIILSGFKPAKNVDDLNEKIAKIGKSAGEFSMIKIKKKFGIEFNFRKDKDKVPDCIFLKNGHLYILEAKHVNGQGGAQNSSISELVSILELSERKPNVHYVSFLDGCYTKYLSLTDPNKRGNKLEKQKYRIEEALNKNKNNYFLNTAGFEKFISDLKG